MIVSVTDIFAITLLWMDHLAPLFTNFNHSCLSFKHSFFIPLSLKVSLCTWLEPLQLRLLYISSPVLSEVSLTLHVADHSATEAKRF